MFQINTREIKKLESDLNLLANKALPFATRSTLNKAAFVARGKSQSLIKEKMITRNKFTVQSIQVDMAKTLNINNQSSTIGSTAGYMEDQEFGSTKVKKEKKGVPLATSYSAGQGMESQPRTRLPRKPNQLANISLKNKRKKGKGRKQQNLIAIKEAAKSKDFVYLELNNNTQGIFKVIGGMRKPKIRMIYDMSEKSVNIPKNPWLKPSFDATIHEIPEIYNNSLMFQINRLKLFNR